MSGFADEPTVQAPSPVPDGSPTPLLWLYLQVAVLVGSIGVALGSVFFHGHRALALPYGQAITRCTRTHGVDPLTDQALDLARSNHFLACMSEPSRVLGTTMLAGGALLLVGLALVVGVTPVVDHWRLRRRRLASPIVGIEQRFAELSDRLGLHGRHRPGLLVAGPPLRQAFTTVRPGGRPLVVLPAGVAVAYRDQARFDPVVLHELAHVRGRDVRWVAAVRGLLWLVLPAVLAVSFELRITGTPEIPAVTIGRALLLVLLSVLLQALLLRRREHEADRQALRTGDPAALVRLLDAAAVRQRPRSAWLTRLFARHPTPRQRSDALRSAPKSSDGGPVQAAVTGAVTAIAAGAVTHAASALAMERDLAVLPAAVVGLLLGFGLTPALRRRALADAAVSRWPPVVGAAAGLAVGGLLFPTATLGGGAAFPVATTSVSVSLRYALLIALTGAVAVTACTVLAGLLAERGRVRPTGPARPLTYLAAAATVTVLCWPLSYLAVSLTRSLPVRAWLVYALPDAPWPWLGLAWPVAIVALVGWRRVVGHPVLPTVAVAVLIGGAVASAAALRSPPDSLDAALALAQQRWWICALGGWAALVVLGAGRGDLGLGRAVVAGAGVALLTGTSQFVHQLLAGRSPDLLLLRLSVGVPVIWWLYLALLTAPLLAALPARARRAGRRSAPVGAAAAPGRRTRPWRVLAAPAAVVLVSAAAAGGLPGGPVPLPAPASATPTPTAVPTPTDGVAPGRFAHRHRGRPLTAAEAAASASAVRGHLPAYWQPAKPRPSSGAVIEPAACRPLADDEYLRVLEPDERVDQKRVFATRRAPAGIARSTVTVSVASHAHPVPATVLDAAEAFRAGCPRFAATTAGEQPVRFTVRAPAAPPVGEQSWLVRYDFSVGSGSGRITGATLFGVVRIGHNLIQVQLTAIAEPLDEALFGTAVAATLAALPD